MELDPDTLQPKQGALRRTAGYVGQELSDIAHHPIRSALGLIPGEPEAAEAYKSGLTPDAQSELAAPTSLGMEARFGLLTPENTKEKVAEAEKESSERAKEIEASPTQRAIVGGLRGAPKTLAEYELAGKAFGPVSSVTGKTGAAATIGAAFGAEQAAKEEAPKGEQVDAAKQAADIITGGVVGGGLGYGGSLLEHAHLAEPYLRAQGMTPQVGPEASVEAQEAAAEPSRPEAPKEEAKPAAEEGRKPSEAETPKEVKAPVATEVAPSPAADVPPAVADQLTALSAHPHGSIEEIKVGDLRKNSDLLKVDPDRFQFKQNVNDKGVGKDLGDINEYKTGLSDVLTAYHAPDGNFIIDGHHRLDAALRLADDNDVIRYQWLDSGNSIPGAIEHNVTDAAARAFGALKNMANQRGTAYDMAKFMRESDMGAADLAKMGISLTEAKTSDALAMKNLSPFLWQQFRTGNLRDSLAVTLGRELPDDQIAQDDLYKLISGKEVKGEMRPQQLTNLIRLSKGVETVPEEGGSLFGKDFFKKTTLPQQALILDQVQTELERDARRMSGTAKEQELLESAGQTKIDKPELEAKAREAKTVAELLPKFAYNADTDTNAAIKEMAYRLAGDSKLKGKILGEARAAISQAVMRDARQAGLSGEQFSEPAPEEPSLFGGKGTELSGGIVPVQAAKHLQGLGAWVMEKLSSGKVSTTLKAAMAPEMVDTFSKRESTMVEEKAAELRARVGSARHLWAPLHSFYQNVIGAGDDWKQAFQIYSKLEHGNLDALPKELQPFQKMAREAFDTVHERIQKIKGGDAGYRDDYLPHMYAEPPDRVKEVFGSLKNATGRALTGPKGFLQSRTYRDMMEAITEGGLTPKFKNPVDMMLAGLQNEWRYVTGQELFNNMKDAGLARFFKFGENPKGWAPIDDKIAKVRTYSPTEHGYIERGHYMAPEAAARVLNNHLGPGLGSRDGIFGPLSSASAIGNQIRVGLSAFHIMLEANSAADIEAGGVIGEGLGRIAHGDLKGGLSALSRVPRTWMTPVELYKTIAKGREVQGAAHAGMFEDPAVKSVLLGGGSFDYGDSIMTEALTRAFQDKFGTKLGRAGRVAHGIADSVLGFTMKKVVTPAKLGSFLSLYDTELKRAYAANGGEDIPFVQRREIASNVRRHLDDTMGQIARDNLHFGNKMKDALSLIIGFPGWNIGTVRLFGGIVRGAGELMTGRELDPQARLALQFAAGKAIRAGITGTVINRLVTGHMPQSIVEMYTWPTGQKDKNGNYIRVSPPEYLIRDLLSYMGHEKTGIGPGHALVETAMGKLNWPLAAGYEIYRNADFFNRPITFRDSSVPANAMRIVKHIAEAGGVPFALTNIKEQAEEKGTDVGSELKAGQFGALAKQGAVGVLGLTPAPSSLRQTPMQNFVFGLLNQQGRQAPQASSPEQMETDNQVRRFKGEMRDYLAGRTKQRPDIKPLIDARMTQKQIAHTLKGAKISPIEAALEQVGAMPHGQGIISLAQAWQVANKDGNENDMKIVRNVAIRRLKTEWPQLTPEQRKQIGPIINKMLSPKTEREAAIEGGGV
jgi:nucleotide-binding universal stress UspA family protein